jgi:uncharacterized protein YeaO (DUF488 family)
MSVSSVIHTARVSTRDPDAVNITRKSADSFGIVFAPSWAILGPVLRERKAGREFDWSSYVEAYTAEMRRSYTAHGSAWRLMLSRPRTVLTCYCTDPERCHRTILARTILPALGATYGGELS